MNEIHENFKNIRFLYSSILLINIFSLKCTVFAVETSLNDLPEPILIEILVKAAQEGSFNQFCQLFSLTRTNKKFYRLLHKTDVTTKLENPILDKNEEIKQLLANIKKPEQANRKLFDLALLSKYALVHNTQQPYYENNFIIAMLINRGAIINARYQESTTLINDSLTIPIRNSTPLFCAVSCNISPNFICALLAHKANANAANKNGTTVLMIARLRGLKHIIYPLLAHGADKNTQDNEGKTVYDEKYGRLDISISIKEFKKMVKYFKNHNREQKKLYVT